MDSIKDIIYNSSNDNNVNNNNIENNDNNDIIDNNYNNNKKDYALDENLFTPNSEETLLAKEIATAFKDLENYAYYLYVVNKIGCMRTHLLYSSVLGLEKEKRNTKYPIRKITAYFRWKFKYDYPEFK